MLVSQEITIGHLDSFLNAVDGVCEQTANFIIIIHEVSVSNAHKKNVCRQARQLLGGHSWPHIYNRPHTQRLD